MVRKGDTVYVLRFSHDVEVFIFSTLRRAKAHVAQLVKEHAPEFDGGRWVKSDFDNLPLWEYTNETWREPLFIIYEAKLL